jgi:hypothetical protein
VRRGAGGSGGETPSGATGGARVGDFLYGSFCGEWWAAGVGRFKALFFLPAGLQTVGEGWEKNGLYNSGRRGFVWSRFWYTGIKFMVDVSHRSGFCDMQWLADTCPMVS